MEITVNLSALMQHRYIPQQELTKVRELIDAVEKAYDFERSLGMYCEDTYPPALHDLRLVKDSMEARIRFLEDLNDQVRLTSERSGLIVDELTRAQEY